MSLESPPSLAVGERFARTRRMLQERRRPPAERSFLSLGDLDAEVVARLVRGGLDAKEHPERYARALGGKAVALLFQKTSTRTRVSFEVGVAEMGGQPLFMDWRTSNFTLADLGDEIQVLSRYVDLVMARVYGHEDLETMASRSEVPVINGLSDRYHPCQGLADYLTMLEYFGPSSGGPSSGGPSAEGRLLEGLTLAYLGDGNNVCQTLLHGAARLGVTIRVAHPPEYAPDAAIVAAARREAGRDDAVVLTQDPREAVDGADVLYTDTWVSMGDEAETAERKAILGPFQLNGELQRRAPGHALVMHCLPAHRGDEITDEVMDSANAVVVDQAENRKHAQKYLMAWLVDAAPDT